jgi:hypothetical protein
MRHPALLACLLSAVSALPLAAQFRSDPPRRPFLFKDARGELAAARARGDTMVTLVVASMPGANARAVRLVTGLGGTVRFRDDDVDYLRVHVPLASVERLVSDLDIPVRLIFGETLRESDGLAMSSRNTYLSPEERAKAPVLHRALRAGEEAITHGIHEVAGIEKLMNRVITEEGGVEVDYLAVVDPETFEAPADFDREVLLAGAVKIGRTRLIDNIRVRA